MSYTVRTALLIPLGLDALLLLCLLLISFLLKGTTTEKLVFAAFFLPVLYLVLECTFRRVTVGEEGLAVRKLGREKKVAWEEITHVGSLTIRKKVYLLLTTVKGFFVISNVYGRFPALLDVIVAHIEPERVEEGVRQLSGCIPTGGGNILSAWVAAVFMIGIVLMRLFPLWM